MGDNLYWITAFTLAVVLIMILIEERKVAVKSRKGSNSYTALLSYSVFFCIQDGVWGLCDSKIIGGDSAFFISSSVFHLAVVFATYFWLRFVLDYLGDRVKHRKFYLTVEILTIIIQIVLVITNLFKPVLFRIENGMYVTEFLRPLSFLNQYLIYFGGGMITLFTSLGSERNKEDKIKAVFWFSFAPIVMGVFQLLYPDAPFYSIGYFFGCFIVHVFIVSKEREKLTRSFVLDSIANTYYTMHLFNLKDDVMEDFIESDIVNSFIKDRNNPQDAISSVMRASSTDEYRDTMLEFVDLKTLPERLKDKNIISIDFLGRFHGWTRSSFITVDRDEDGTLLSVMHTTQIIDEQKKKEQEMLAKSTTDPLTGLYNRRAYEHYISKHPENDQNMVYVSIDVNGLKTINDTIGHAAGDELLVGATQCMRQSFGAYGRIYRIGGDEFAIILFATEEELLRIKEDFEYVTGNWKGENVDRVEMSCGYVTRRECKDISLSEIARIADKRMYKEKALFYQKKGIDRRGQNDAYKVLCSLYTKILKINITDDSFSIISMNKAEQTVEKGYSDKISEWLSGFAKCGCVHPDDVNSYLEKTDIEYMRKYFSENAGSLTIMYRRKNEEGYQPVVMEIVPANDYTNDNQLLFLYVK